MKKVDFGLIYHMSDFYIRGILVCRDLKVKRVIRGNRSVTLYSHYCIVFNYLYPINNQLTIYYRGTRVLVVQPGRKASQESL